MSEKYNDQFFGRTTVFTDCANANGQSFQFCLENRLLLFLGLFLIFQVIFRWSMDVCVSCWCCSVIAWRFIILNHTHQLVDGAGVGVETDRRNQHFPGPLNDVSTWKLRFWFVFFQKKTLKLSGMKRYGQFRIGCIKIKSYRIRSERLHRDPFSVAHFPLGNKRNWKQR